MQFFLERAIVTAIGTIRHPLLRIGFKMTMARRNAADSTTCTARRRMAAPDNNAMGFLKSILNLRL